MQNYKELLEIFPEARSFLKADLASFNLQAEEKLQEVRNATIAVEESGRSARWFYDMCLENRQNEYDALMKEARRLEWALNPKPATENTITQDDIDMARDVLISDFIEFNYSGYTLCIAHEEDSPSMYYYKKDNKVHCFSCGFHQDSIGVIMHLHDLEFLDAVRLLIKK